MTAIVIGMVLIVIVALVVISVFSEEEDDDWSVKRPGRPDPNEGHLDDLLGD
jgi:multisubunit Na+/H+ antiporter MnhC subunit